MKIQINSDRILMYVLFVIVIILLLFMKCQISSRNDATVIKYKPIPIPVIQKDHQTIVEKPIYKIIYKTEKPETVYIDTETVIPVESLPKMTREPMIQVKYNYSRRLLSVTTLSFYSDDSSIVKTRIYDNVNPVFQATSLPDSVSVLSKRIYSELYSGAGLSPSVSNLKSFSVTPEVYLGYSLNNWLSLEGYVDLQHIGLRVRASKRLRTY